ncbi:MAG: hypothetical protein KAH23_05885 [Kiritimatiellae bacterium]|nr:hypothetical protein [Kiritimatiellia bacterium]
MVKKQKGVNVVSCADPDPTEIGEWLSGVAYKTVSKTVERFSKRMDADNELAKTVKRCLYEM